MRLRQRTDGSAWPEESAEAIGRIEEGSVNGHPG
jgi:hypothetical protein